MAQAVWGLGQAKTGVLCVEEVRMGEEWELAKECLPKSRWPREKRGYMEAGADSIFTTFHVLVLILPIEFEGPKWES